MTQQNILEEIENFLCSYGSNEQTVTLLKWSKTPVSELIKLIKAKRNSLVRTRSDSQHIVSRTAQLINALQ